MNLRRRLWEFVNKIRPVRNVVAKDYANFVHLVIAHRCSSIVAGIGIEFPPRVAYPRKVGTWIFYSRILGNPGIDRVRVTFRVDYGHAGVMTCSEQGLLGGVAHELARKVVATERILLQDLESRTRIPTSPFLAEPFVAVSIGDAYGPSSIGIEPLPLPFFPDRIQTNR